MSMPKISIGLGIILVVLGVRSFIAARRWKQENPGVEA